MTFRHAGFIATLTTGLLMLAGAVHGMARLDTTLRLAAVQAHPAKPVHRAHRGPATV